MTYVHCASFKFVHNLNKLDPNVIAKFNLSKSNWVVSLVVFYAFILFKKNCLALFVAVCVWCLCVWICVYQ